MSFTLTELEAFRSRQDPIADTLVADLIRDHGVSVVNQLLPTLTRNYELKQELFPDAIGQRIGQYLDETAQPPSWANPEAIRIAQNLFADHGITIALLLQLRSLPMTYACAHGARVLYETGLMTARDGKANLVRRLMETAQFVIFCMEPGGLDPGGRGIVTAQKVRLIHACIRHYLNHRGWDHAIYGAPINQEDMAGTLLAFSALIIEGLEMSGFTLSQEQKDAYIHCWNVISHWNGLDPALLAPDYASALQLGYAILDHQQAASTAGTQLTAALITEAQTQVGGLLKDTIPALIRYYCTDQIGDLLGVPAEPLAKEHQLADHIKLLEAKIQHVEEKHAFLRWMLGRMSVDFLQLSTTMFNHFKNVQFYIPTYLTEGASEFDALNHHR
ncbi:oxygenase MpaB family protein [Larkinella insperata]|uniref:Oxygenase MpaB family protein n=1 Tax=Larkinella insperata TaxID=332158 RepID=A0ABW3Q7C0_9BACT|nr:oxygenase MpaB family protein [Larkinella insperata]